MSQAAKLHTNGNGSPDYNEPEWLSSAEEFNAVRNETPFVRRSLKYMLDKPAKPWLIDNIIGPGETCMIYGGPGTGKTFAVIDMIFAACLGKKWAMQFDATRVLTVAYCAGEGLGGLPARLHAAAQRWGAADIENLYIYENVPQLFDSKSPTSMRRFITSTLPQSNVERRYQIDILIIDTMHSATSGADENSAKDATVVLESAKLARTILNCAVILVHHANKGGTIERGSSALRADIDSVIEISKSGEHRYMSCVKVKDAQSWDQRQFSLTAMADSVRVWWEDPARFCENQRQRKCSH